MSKSSQDVCYHNMGAPEAIWAISAVHSDVDRLAAIHDGILEKFKSGDRILYTGNYTGYGKKAVETIDEILTFRRMIMSIRGVLPTDLIYLRGAQEEMWQKLLQIQFAPNPSDVLLWMLGNGLSGTLESYGLCPHDGIEACRRGTMDITKWTNSIRQALRKQPGHETFTTHYSRAAFTSQETPYPMLFVNAGLDAQKSLNEQGDNLWWGANKFESIENAYKPYEKVVRGYDPKHKGVKMNCITATIDGGCGFGGDLVCAGFTPEGSVDQWYEA